MRAGESRCLGRLQRFPRLLLCPGSCWLPRHGGHGHGTACSLEIYLPPHIASGARGGGRCSPYVCSGTPASLPRPKGCHAAPNPSGSHGDGVGHSVPCGRKETCLPAWGGDCLQVQPLPTWQDSREHPGAPSAFFRRADAMSGQASSICCRCCGGVGDLGAEQEHPGHAESKFRARKVPYMNFSQEAVPGQLSPFPVLINARGSWPGARCDARAPKPAQEEERIWPLRSAHRRGSREVCGGTGRH